MSESNPKVAGSVELPPHVEHDSDVGRLLLPSHCRFVTPYVAACGNWEPEEVALYRTLVQPGMTALDVGAHVGYFTLLLARLVGSQGRVVAVEADPANHALLCENVIRNGATNVRVVHAAAAAVSGTATLSVCEDNTGDHRAYSWNSGRRTLTVPALALDELDPPFESLDIVKLDVQGTEHRVLAGLAETLRRCRPTVVAEFWPEGIRDLGDDPVAVIECYRSWGLRTRVLGGPADSGMPAVDVVQLAETGPTRFCTLLLEPS